MQPDAEPAGPSASEALSDETNFYSNKLIIKTMKTRLLKLALSAVVAALPIGAWAEGTGYDEVFMVDYAKIATEKWNVTASETRGSQQISRNVSVDKRIDNEKVYPFQVIKSESTILDYNEVYVASGNYYLSLISVDLIGLRCTNSTATRIGIFDLQKDDIVEIATNGGNASNATPTESAPTTPYNLSAFAKQDGTYGHTYVHTASRTARYYVYKATVSADGAVSFMVSNNCYIAYIKVLRPYTAYTLTTTASPAAGGSISGNDDGTYKANTTVNLTATPNDGYKFVSWTGVDSSDGATATVTMNADKNVTATFEKKVATTVWKFDQYVASAALVSSTANSPASEEYTDGLYFHTKSQTNDNHKVVTLERKNDGSTFSSQTTTYAASSTYMAVQIGKAGSNTVSATDASAAVACDGIAYKAPAAGTFYATFYAGSAADVAVYKNSTESPASTTNFSNKEGKEISVSVAANDVIYLVNTSSSNIIALLEASFVPTTADAVTKTVNITNAGYATFSATQNYDLPSGLEAYIVSGVNETTATMTKVDEIPACTGVILKGAEGSYTLTSKETTSVDVSSNMLKANITDYTLPADDGTNYNYILVAGASSAVFKHSSGSGTLAANKAFLRTTTNVTSSGAPGFTLDFGTGTTGITEIEKSVNAGNEAVFNLNGQRVAQPKKGLYIVNGKKVIIK